MFITKIKHIHIKKFIKKYRFIIITFFALVIIFISFTTNVNVQTYFAQKIANKFNKQYGTDLQIKTVELNYSGNVDLNNFLIKDHKNDTLIFVQKLFLSPVGLKKMISDNLNFKSIEFEGLKLNVVKYLDDEENNLQIFLRRLKTNSNALQDESKLNFIIGKINSKNSEFLFKDFNSSKNNFKLSNLKLELSDLNFLKDQIELKVNYMSFINDLGYTVNHFSSSIYLKNNSFGLNKMVFNYGKSNLNGDLFFDFSRIDNLDTVDLQNLDSLYVDFNFKNSKISPSDFSSFFKKINKNYTDFFNIETRIKGFVNELSVDRAIVSNENNFLEFDSKISNLLKKEKDYKLDFNFQNFTSSSKEINKLVPEIFGVIIPSSTKNVGKFKYDGFVTVFPSKVKSNFNLFLEKGVLNASLSISDLSNIDNAKYIGSVKGTNIDISKFINFKAVGNSDFEFEISGRGFTSKYLNSSVTGNISKINFKNQIFVDLDVFGKVKDQVFDGKLTLNDPNLNLNFNGLIDFSNDLIDFDFNSSVNYANLLNLGLSDFGELYGEFNVKLRGNNMDDLIGDLTLRNLTYKKIDKITEFKDLNAQLRKNDGNRIINISSDDIVSGILIGEYDFSNLKSSILNNFGVQYSNYKLIKPYKFQNISFNLNFKPKFLKIINNNLSIDENTFVSGKFKSNGDYNLKFESSFVKFKDLYATNLNVDINNKSGFIEISRIDSDLISGNDFKIITNFINGSHQVNSSFRSSRNEINRISFNHTIDKNNKSVISFYDMELSIKNQKWVIDEKQNNILPVLSFSRDKKDFSFTDANFISGEQNLNINITEDTDNSNYYLNFKNVSLENITSNKNKIFLEALINGKVELIKNNEIYQGNSALKLENLRANNFLLGTANLNINASNDLKSFLMSFEINDTFQKTLDLNGSFSIEENFYPIQMELVMNNFDIQPFSKIGDNVLTNFKGFFNSKISISGNSETPKFNGNINTKDVEFLIPYLNVNYKLINNPSFKLTNQTFELNNFVLHDATTKSNGLLSGTINHNKFKNWFLDLKIETENLLILDTSFENEPVYFGKGFLKGNANINGPGENLLIDISGSTNKGTKLTIPIKQSKNIGDLSFLNFNNNNDDIKDLNSNNNGLKVNLDLQFNPNATIDVIFDSESSSRLISRGDGNLNFKINTKGNFNIFGDYTVSSGSYFYKTLGIVDREFILSKGSSIIWNGNPYLADLNINANYDIPGGANPAILIQNTSFNRKIPTNIDVNLTGNLIEMNTPNFNINFPNTSGPIKSEIEYYLVDEEKKQKQAISLLYQNTFIDEISLSSVSSQAITNNLFQKASGIIDDIFTNSEDKMSVGVNYLKGDKNAESTLLNRDRLGLTLKTEISEKILINGKVGVPVGGFENNVIIGDVQIEFLLNKEGNFKARFFNKENEYQYFGNEIGYTQGMGISYELDFDSIKELLKKNKTESK